MNSMSTEQLKDLEKDQMSKDPDELKQVYTKTNPHITGAYWDETISKWQGYKPMKGISPPWVPYSKKRKRTEPSIRAKKFLWVLSKTGSIRDAAKAVCKLRPEPDKRIESAKYTARGKQMMGLIRTKYPEYFEKFTFDDFGPDFVRNQYMDLFNNENATIGEKKAILDSMAKIEQLFSEKKQIDIKIKEVVTPVYKEAEEDFPEEDNRLSRIGVELLDEYTDESGTQP